MVPARLSPTEIAKRAAQARVDSQFIRGQARRTRDESARLHDDLVARDTRRYKRKPPLLPSN